MSYYSNNYYPNYSYGNPYTNQMQTQPAISALQGKIVDSADVVKVTEVPFGGFAVFPKGDMSEIYVKSWTSNGTTQINTYKPIPVEETPEAKQADAITLLSQQITNLENKLDTFINNVTPTPIAENKTKGVNVNAY